MWAKGTIGHKLSTTTIGNTPIPIIIDPGVRLSCNVGSRKKQLSDALSFLYLLLTYVSDCVEAEYSCVVIEYDKQPTPPQYLFCISVFVKLTSPLVTQYIGEPIPIKDAIY